MTTRELERSETCVARARSTPCGETELVPGDENETAYGPVEVAWFPDRLEITAVGAGLGSITAVHPSGEMVQDVVVEIRLPRLDELTETCPGAD